MSFLTICGDHVTSMCHVALHVTCMSFSCRLFKSTDTSGDQKLDYDEFVAILKKMDRNLKNLPATAQVASQQVRLDTNRYNTNIIACSVTL